MQIPHTHSSINLFASTPFSANKDTASKITLQLGPYDVLCNRSRKAFNYIGNRRFRILVENNSHCYSKTTSKAERSRIVLSIVKTIQSAGGRFLTRAENSTWAEVSMTKAKEKVGHALRFAISCKESGEERTIHDIIASDSSSAEEPATKKRKLSNDVVPKLCHEGHSTDVSLICKLMGMESALPDVFESPCEQVDCEQSSETMADEDAIDLLLNDPIIFDFDPVEDDNEPIDEDLVNAMESLADPDGVFDGSIFCW